MVASMFDQENTSYRANGHRPSDKHQPSEVRLAAYAERLQAVTEAWQDRALALTEIRDVLADDTAMVASGAHLAKACNVLREPLAMQLDDRRSQITKEAFQTVSALADAFAASDKPTLFAYFAPDMVVKCLKKAGDAKQAISRPGVDCLNHMVCAFPGGMRKLLGELLVGAKEKAAGLRKASMHALELAFKHWHTPGVFAKAKGQLEEVVATGCRDADRETRASARLCFIHYCNVFPDREAIALARLDRSTLRDISATRLQLPAGTVPNSGDASSSNTVAAVKTKKPVSRPIRRASRDDAHRLQDGETGQAAETAKPGVATGNARQQDGMPARQSVAAAQVESQSNDNKPKARPSKYSQRVVRRSPSDTSAAAASEGAATMTQTTRDRSSGTTFARPRAARASSTHSNTTATVSAARPKPHTAAHSDGPVRARRRENASSAGLFARERVFGARDTSVMGHRSRAKADDAGAKTTPVEPAPARDHRQAAAARRAFRRPETSASGGSMGPPLTAAGTTITQSRDSSRDSSNSSVARNRFGSNGAAQRHSTTTLQTKQRSSARVGASRRSGVVAAASNRTSSARVRARLGEESQDMVTTGNAAVVGPARPRSTSVSSHVSDESDTHSAYSQQTATGCTPPRHRRDRRSSRRRGDGTPEHPRRHPQGGRVARWSPKPDLAHQHHHHEDNNTGGGMSPQSASKSLRHRIAQLAVGMTDTLWSNRKNTAESVKGLLESEDTRSVARLLNKLLEVVLSAVNDTHYKVSAAGLQALHSIVITEHREIERHLPNILYALATCTVDGKVVVNVQAKRTMTAIRQCVPGDVLVRHTTTACFSQLERINLGCVEVMTELVPLADKFYDTPLNLRRVMKQCARVCMYQAKNTDMLHSCCKLMGALLWRDADAFQRAFDLLDVKYGRELGELAQYDEAVSVRMRPLLTEVKVANVTDAASASASAREFQAAHDDGMAAGEETALPITGDGPPVHGASLLSQFESVPALASSSMQVGDSHMHAEVMSVTAGESSNANDTSATAVGAFDAVQSNASVAHDQDGDELSKPQAVDTGILCQPSPDSVTSPHKLTLAPTPQVSDDAPTFGGSSTSLAVQATATQMPNPVSEAHVEVRDKEMEMEHVEECVTSVAMLEINPVKVMEGGAAGLSCDVPLPPTPVVQPEESESVSASSNPYASPPRSTAATEPMSPTTTNNQDVPVDERPRDDEAVAIASLAAAVTAAGDVCDSICANDDVVEDGDDDGDVDKDHDLTDCHMAPISAQSVPKQASSTNQPPPSTQAHVNDRIAFFEASAATARLAASASATPSRDASLPPTVALSSPGVIEQTSTAPVVDESRRVLDTSEFIAELAHVTAAARQRALDRMRECITGGHEILTGTTSIGGQSGNSCATLDMLFELVTPLLNDRNIGVRRAAAYCAASVLDRARDLFDSKDGVSCVDGNDADETKSSSDYAHGGGNHRFGGAQVITAFEAMDYRHQRLIVSCSRNATPEWTSVFVGGRLVLRLQQPTKIDVDRR